MGVMEWMNEDNGHGHGNVDVDVCGWRLYLYVMDRLEKVTDVFRVVFIISFSCLFHQVFLKSFSP
jgi:hypothetical protein